MATEVLPATAADFIVVAMTHDARGYDAVLVLSYGGPEGPDEVVPFLKNVTRGKNIPEARLKQVGEHYYRFGGVSPLNAQNRALIENLDAELRRRGRALPVYFGNRNWHPLVEDTVEEMSVDGVRRAVVFATSAWGGYSGSTQYDEDIQRARCRLTEHDRDQIDFFKLRQFFNHPIFIDAVAESLAEARKALAAKHSGPSRVVFTAHSVPVDEAPGAERPSDSELYAGQVREAARLVAERAQLSDYDVVWQSRSGHPHTPWLEPDVTEHVASLNDDAGITGVVICPIGFISDHMEVIWDLDTELAAEVRSRGMSMERATTVGLSPEFAGMVADLIEERETGADVRRLGDLPVGGATLNGEPVS